jgi:hypothetical protein
MVDKHFEVELPEEVLAGFGWYETEVPHKIREALVMDLLRLDQLSEAQAAALCQQVGESSQRFAVLDALSIFHYMRAEYQAAQAVAEQFLDLAQRQHDPAQLLRVHGRLSQTLFNVGSFVLSRTWSRGLPS